VISFFDKSHEIGYEHATFVVISQLVRHAYALMDLKSARAKNTI
jgi:hypothetical protein